MMTMQQAMDERRTGVFYVSRDALRCGGADLLMKMLNAVLVVRCEYLFDRDSFEYVGYSPDFESLESGAKTPTYVGIFESLLAPAGDIKAVFHGWHKA